MAQQIILPKDADLRGRNLTPVYEKAKNSPDPETFSMFKKKEPLDNMAKSILKHRIQSLTGKAAGDIEEEMGYPSTRAGGGVPVEVLRRLAHFLILEASGQLESAKPQIQVKEADSPKTAPTRKRGATALAATPSPQVPESQVSADPGPQAKKARASRKSMAPNISQIAASNVDTITPKRGRRSMMPEMLQSMVTAVSETIGCRLTPSAGNTTAAIQEQQDDEMEVEKEAVKEPEEVKVEDLGLGANPTPMMIAQKRRSLAVSMKTTPGKKVAVSKTPPPRASVPAPIRASAPPKKIVKEEAEVKPALMSPTAERRKSAALAKQQLSPAAPPKKAVGVEAPVEAQLAAPQPGFPGLEDTKIYLAEGNPSNLTFEKCVELAPGFEGANLIVIHTPVEWEALDLFNCTKSIRKINAKAELDSFLILVGCGLSNMHNLRDALLTQTKHVQFVIFERANQNLAGHKDGIKLREVASYFLLAYFFPGCETEDSEPSDSMVRPGFTNVFQTKTAEDLENKIVYVLSEQGDWILDLYCHDREISLAAQKTGRNVLAVDPRSDGLFSIKTKASIIAEHNSKDFRKNTDGIIQHF